MVLPKIGPDDGWECNYFGSLGTCTYDIRYNFTHVLFYSLS
jgi:hypothetical protein